MEFNFKGLKMTKSQKIEIKSLLSAKLKYQSDYEWYVGVINHARAEAKRNVNKSFIRFYRVLAYVLTARLKRNGWATAPII